MSENTPHRIAVTVVILFLCGIALAAYKVWQFEEESEFHSCISSISDELRKLDTTKDLMPEDKSWKMLNKDEVEFLMQQVHGRKCIKSDNPGLDIWNHGINIALRKSTEYPDMIIWSNGRDGISGTEDDLVMPYGTKVPKQ